MTSRVHSVTVGSRDPYRLAAFWAEVLGATLADDRRRPDGSGWAVLHDPEGNEFRVVRNASERALAHPA
ncbi:VOC family protein [Streptomyces chumphonensis]